MTKCKTCGHEIPELEIIDFGYAKFQITKPKKCLTYKEAEDNIPKGFRLPEVSELMKLYELGWMDNIEKGELIFFWGNQSEIEKKKGIACGVFRDNYAGLEASWGYLAYSCWDGRVVYIKEVEE